MTIQKEDITVSREGLDILLQFELDKSRFILFKFNESLAFRNSEGSDKMVCLFGVCEIIRGFGDRDVLLEKNWAYTMLAHDFFEHVPFDDRWTFVMAQLCEWAKAGIFGTLGNGLNIKWKMR